MTRLTTIQTTFASGEIDPKLRAQTNLKVYNEGAYRLRNLARLATGGVETRAPTLDLASLPSITRLVEFEFSNTQRYLMAFYHTGLIVFGLDGEKIMQVFGAPWTSASIFEMTYSQNADVMTLAHHDFLFDLRRVSARSFELKALAFEASTNNYFLYQPYFKFADDAVTMTPSGSTGDINLTASGTQGWGGFVADHVGRRIKIYDGEIVINSVTSTTAAAGTVQKTLKGKLDLDAFRSKKGSFEIEVLHPFHGLAAGASVTFSGANDIGMTFDSAGTKTGGIDAAQLNVTATVTPIDEHRYTFTAGGTTAAGVSEDGGGPAIEFSVAGSPTRVWFEPSISKVRGYPATVCFHEGRRWLAGTPSQPDGFFGSAALKPNRFDVGKGYDGDSVQGAVGLESISGVRHLISNGDLQVFTATAEAVFVVRPGEPITPSNVRVVGAAGAGCGNVMPQVFDGATLYVQENGLSVHELVFSDQLQRYVATPVSAIAGHLLASGVRDCAVTPGSTSRAEQYAFFPVELGGVAVFHSMRAENVAGWTYWNIAGGKVRSVASVGSYVFFVIERADGTFRLYRTVGGSRDWLLDGAVEHTSATEQTTWTLDARVRNRTVGLYSERGFHGLFAIPADGSVTLSLPVRTLTAGDPFYAELETVTPRVDLPNGGRDRMVKRIVRTIVELEEARSVVIDGTAVSVRQTGADPSVAVQPFTGSYEFRRLGYSRSPTVTITQEEPTFMRILGITMEVQA